MQRFLCNQWEHSQAQKRGGGTTTISWDHELAENLYLKESADGQSPREAFRSTVGADVAGSSDERFGGGIHARGSSRTISVLQPFIVGEAEHGDYAGVAASLELTEGNARQWVLRMRRRYGERLRERIAETVETDAAVEEELRSLQAALSG